MRKSYEKSCALNFLTALVNGDNICRLCMGKIADKEFSINDDVIIEFDDLSSKKITSLAQILCIVLNTQEHSLGHMTKICAKCFQKTLQSYKFIKQCHRNEMVIGQTVQLLNSCLETPNLGSKKAAYFTLNPEKNEFKALYDTKISPMSCKEAHKRIKALVKNQKTKMTEVDDFSNTENDVFDRNYIDYNCQHCAKTFTVSKGLRAHVLRVHAPKNFKCRQCPRKFGSSYLLKLHKSKSHITVMCSECGKTYNNMHSLKLHESGHHSKLTCPSCGGSYKKRLSHERHCKQCLQVSTEKVEKYICDICAKEYSQKGSLRVHISFEHGNGKSFSCNWCHKKFPTISKMKAHTVKHTKERNFVCSYCGGKFVTKESLLYHTRIHTGEAPYKCNNCKETFISASRRTDHIRRKHQEATLECEICKQKFRTMFCLKKHKNRHFNSNSSLFVDSTIVES